MSPCAVHFEEIFDMVEIWAVICLYLLSGLEFLTRLCSSDPSFNGNILTSLYLKSETFAHAQLCHYSFIHTMYKFHDMVFA